MTNAFTNPGGTPVNPSRTSYGAITLTADIVLEWSWVNQDTSETVAYINDVTADVDGWTITMPSAAQAPTGQDQIFYNKGGFQFIVLDADGNELATVDAGRALYLYVTDNSDAAGTWQTFTFGAGASLADAASLAGKGLIALTSMLNVNAPVEILGSSTQLITSANRGGVFVVSSAVGSGTLSFDPLLSLGNGFYIEFSNQGSGVWTINPDGSESIDGQSTININPGESCSIHVGATGLFTIGRGRNVQFAFTQLNLDVSGSADVTLTLAQAGNVIQRYFGTLTGNIDVIVPDTVSVFDVVNDTTGAFTLTVKTAAGTGLVIAQGQTALVRCDGTDVFDADTTAPTPASQQFADGSAGSPSLTFTNDTNLGAYRISADKMGFTANGNLVWSFNASGIDASATGADLKKGGLDISFWAALLG